MTAGNALFAAHLATAGRALVQGRPSWDWWSLVGIVLVVLLLRFGLRLTLEPWAAAPALVGGLIFSSAIHAWGILPAAAGTVVLFSVGSVRGPQPG